MAIQAIVAYPDRIELIADMPKPVPPWDGLLCRL